MLTGYLLMTVTNLIVMLRNNKTIEHNYDNSLREVKVLRESNEKLESLVRSYRENHDAITSEKDCIVGIVATHGSITSLLKSDLDKMRG